MTTLANDASSVLAADIDSDRDLDVPSCRPRRLMTNVAWYEKSNGAGDFSGPQRAITNQAYRAQSVAAADLDGDTGLDVLSASSFDRKVDWYENECEPTTP